MSESKRIPYASPARPPASLLGLSRRVAFAKSKYVQKSYETWPFNGLPSTILYSVSDTWLRCHIVVVFDFFFSYVISDKRFVSILLIVCGMDHFDSDIHYNHLYRSRKPLTLLFLLWLPPRTVKGATGVPTIKRNTRSVLTRNTLSQHKSETKDPNKTKGPENSPNT